MKTQVYDVTQLNEETLRNIDTAGKILAEGGLVAFPTETVYGLGANAMNPAAAADIYLAKGRPSDNPLIVHIADVSQLEKLARGPMEKALALAEAFWPGPLTMILPKQKAVPDVTTGGLDTVAVRMPEEAAALELIRRAGVPVAAPSANLSGRPSPTTGDHVIQDLSGRVDIILAGNDCRIGIESTILDLSGERAVILRPGFLTPEELGTVLGYVPEIDPAILKKPDSEEGRKGLAPRAPGMKYTHYAPKAPMEIFSGRPERVRRVIEERKKAEESQGKTVGVILFGEDEFERAAHDFFAQLREMDDRKVDLILAGAVDDRDSRGFALMNRMLKSAGYHITYV